MLRWRHKFCNNGDIGPKRTLFYHIHIKMGHINNKFQENKVALVDEDTWKLVEPLGD